MRAKRTKNGGPSLPAVNRRQFLASLAALGAAMVLPANATAAQVDETWQEALRQPWFFDVGEYGTIVEPDSNEPQVNADVYDNIWIGETPDDLVREIDYYDELRGHFQSLAADELEDVEQRLDDEDVSGADRKRLLALRDALRDGDYGWQEWIRLEGPQGLPRFEEAIDKWLAEPVNWNGMEFWPRGWSGQGKALELFQSMDRTIIDAIGVVIIEGEHPGSTYYAAELRVSIEDANNAVERLGLPFRFREESSDAS